jgi:hypothetical protein
MKLVFARPAAGFLLAAAGVYGALYLETASRSRAAFRRAELFRLWASDPERKRHDLESRYLAARDRLFSKRERGAVSEESYRLELDILQAGHEASRADSAAKRAYFSYRDVHRLFSPPETPWSRLARFRGPTFKALWREEVRRNRLPVSEHMLDPEPGEDEGHWAVFSSRRRAAADRWAAALRSREIPAVVAEGRRAPDAFGDGFRVIVPREKFWMAQEFLRPRVDPGLPAIMVKFSP